MITALLLVVLAQVLPCTAGESSLVCHCKQGQVSACETLRQTDSESLRRITEALEAVHQAEQLHQQQAVKAAESEAQGSSIAPQPPDCKGQQHHIISRRIARALEDHSTLRNLYKPRDERFVTRAKDEAAHCGYQQWHRDVDDEVVTWLRDNPEATPQQFMHKLREIYSRPGMAKRFPNGF